ncbi:MAG: GtrA family protein [Bacilli bacterium]|nr:GtrA family protein [Bacilli bacterium]
MSKKRKSLYIQIFKFVVVGGIATLIDWIIYFVLFNYFHIFPLISNIISYSISVIYNFIMSVKWVFDTKDKSMKRLLFEFIVLSLLGLIISEFIIWFFLEILSFDSIIAKILSTLIVMVINFILRKKVLE